MGKFLSGQGGHGGVSGRSLDSPTAEEGLSQQPCKRGCTIWVWNCWNLRTLSPQPLSSEPVWWHSVLTPVHTPVRSLTAPAHDSPVFPTDVFTDTDSGGTWKRLPHLRTHFNNTDPGSLFFHLLEYLMIALGTFRFHNSNFKFCWICG